MNKEDIIRMAREAGWEMDDSCVLEPQVVWYISQGQLERFANLIAASERESCAKLCEWVGQDKNHIGIAAAIRKRSENEQN